MTSTVDQLLHEASELDADKRAELALKLIESLEPTDAAEEVERAWNAEAAERLAAYDAGETTTISAEELHASILADLQTR